MATTELSLDAFCALTALSAEQRKTLGKRGQLPFGSAPSAGQRRRPRDRYSPMDALLTVIALYLGDEPDGMALSRTRAAQIAGELRKIVDGWLPAIAMSADMQSSDDILVGRLQFAGARPTVPFCGTDADLAEILAREKQPIAIVLASATAAAALLRRRAASAKIDLAGFLSSKAPKPPRVRKKEKR